MKTKKRYQDMTATEVAEATKEFDRPWAGTKLPGRAMTTKERARFEAWQKKAMANEAVEDKAESLTLVLPRPLAQRIGELAKQRHTTSAALVKQIVQNAVYQLVA